MTGAVFALQFADPANCNVPVATVTGEIDVTNAEDFAETVSTLSGDGPVVIDLSPLRYLDSAGFAALDRILVERNVVIVVAPDSLIHKAASVMELPFQADTDSALRAVRSRG